MLLYSSVEKKACLFYYTCKYVETYIVSAYCTNFCALERSLSAQIVLGRR